MVHDTYLQCLQSLWMLSGIIVQKVFDTNLKIRYKRIWKKTVILSSFRIEKVKVALFFSDLLYLKLRFVSNIFFDKNFQMQPLGNRAIEKK